MLAFVSRPLLVLAALAVGLAGCENDAAPAEVGESATTTTEATTTDAGTSGRSWDAGVPSVAPKAGASAEGEAAAEEPPEAPVVRPPAPTGGEIVDRDDHVDFALDFLGRQAYNSVDGLMGLYASDVRYFDRGTVSRQAVANDKGNYFADWPNRYYEIAGPVRATAGSRPTIRFDYAFAVSKFDGSNERTGRAWVELGLTPSTNGYVIAAERGGTY